MYKIMIVDDEMWVRRGIRERIDWEGLDAVFAGEASDGEEAYELSLKVKPDIIITDIKMPFLSGIELMELINQDKNAVKIIVVSGYSEFELVQKAMVNKALNYILKPIDEKALNTTIANAIQEILIARKKDEENSSLKITLNQSLPVLREKYLNTLITNQQLKPGEFQKNLASLKVDFKFDILNVMVVRIINFNDLSNDKFDGDTDLLGFSITNLIAELCHSYASTLVFRDSNVGNEYIVLLGHSRSDYQEDIYESVQCIAQEIRNKLDEFLSADTCIGIGKLYGSLDGITKSYNEAAYSSRHSTAQKFYGIEVFDTVKKKVVRDDIIGKVKNHIKNNYSQQINLELIAEKFFINPSYLSRIFKIETGESFVDYVGRIRIEKAKELMYNKALKTHDISQMVGYENPHYFSKIFKTRTGYTPTEYRFRLPETVYTPRNTTNTY